MRRPIVIEVLGKEILLELEEECLFCGEAERGPHDRCEHCHGTGFMTTHQGDQLIQFVLNHLITGTDDA